MMITNYSIHRDNVPVRCEYWIILSLCRLCDVSFIIIPIEKQSFKTFTELAHCKSSFEVTFFAYCLELFKCIFEECNMVIKLMCFALFLLLIKHVSNINCIVIFF